MYKLTSYSYHLVSLNIITGMGILTNTRTKETFRSKIEGQSEGWMYWLRPLNFPTEEDQSSDYSKRIRYGLLNPR